MHFSRVINCSLANFLTTIFFLNLTCLSHPSNFKFPRPYLRGYPTIHLFKVRIRLINPLVLLPRHFHFLKRLESFSLLHLTRMLKI